MQLKIFRTEEGGETYNLQKVLIEAEIKFIVMNSASKEEALNAVMLEAPADYKGTKIDRYRFDSIDENGVIEISVSYKKDEAGSNSGNDNDDKEEQPEKFISVCNFDCSGVSQKITHSLEPQKCVYGDIDAGGAIGWNGKYGQNSEITGADVLTGESKESYTIQMICGDITTAKKRLWKRSVGKVNSTAFKDWQAKELMFMGVTFNGKLQKDAEIDVTFNFRVLDIEEDATINGISCGKKEGNELFSAIQKTEVKDDTIINEVQAIHKSTFARAVDFNSLGKF